MQQRGREGNQKNERELRSKGKEEERKKEGKWRQIEERNLYEGLSG